MIRRFVLTVIVFVGMATPAHALLCNVSISDVAFGNVDVLAGSPVDTTANVSIGCTGVPLTTTRVCIYLNAGTGGADASGRYMLGGSGSLRYQLYQDAGRTVIWGSTTWGFPGGPVEVDIPFGLGGSGNAARTIYARVFGSQTSAPAGAYSSAFSGGHSVVAYATLALFDCSTILGLPPLFTNPAFNVTATVLSNCLVTAQNINFGTQGVLNANVDASGQVSVTCTPSTNYTVGLNGGSAAAAPTARRMSKAAEWVTYGLYRDAARSLPWGDTIGINVAAGSGNGVAQNLPVYGRVPPQATPSAGTYTDTIAVTVTY